MNASMQTINDAEKVIKAYDLGAVLISRPLSINIPYIFSVIYSLHASCHVFFPASS